MKQRIPYVRMLAFVIVGLLAAGLVVVQTAGTDAFRGSYRLTMHLPDTGGIVTNSQVTYRGTPIGDVESVNIDPGGAGISLALRIKSRYRVPKDSVAAVSMDVPIAIEHIDLRPRHGGGPYFIDGDTIPAGQARLPVPFHRFLRHGTDMLASIDTKDLATVGDELQTGLSGMEPQLRRLLANSKDLMRTTEDITPQLIDLTDRGTATLNANRGLVDKLPDLAARIRGMTGHLADLTPKGGKLLDDGNSVLRRSIPMLNHNQRSIAVIIANLASTTQVLSAHLPALVGSMTDAPKGLRKFAGAFYPSREHPGVTDADVDLIGALGPVCYYGTKRRPPQETTDRPVDDNWNCRGDQEYLQQRGSVNAPDQDPRAGSSAPTRPEGSPTPSGERPTLKPQAWSAPLFRGVQ